MTVSSAQRGGDRTSFPLDFSAAASVCIVLLQGEIIRLSHGKEKGKRKMDRLKSIVFFLVVCGNVQPCECVLPLFCAELCRWPQGNWKGIQAGG